jgi:hypothetical protein
VDLGNVRMRTWQEITATEASAEVAAAVVGEYTAVIPGGGEASTYERVEPELVGAGDLSFSRRRLLPA